MNSRLPHLLVEHLDVPAILWPRPAMIPDARGSDDRVTEPFPHLGDAALSIGRVGGDGGTQPMRADLVSQVPAGSFRGL